MKDTPSLVLSGASVGVLLGLLVGMSASPVVASVASGLLGIVVAYATARLGGGVTSAPAAGGSAPATNVRIYLGAFSVAASVAVLGGLYLRTHSVFAPSPKEIVERWKEAGLTQQQAEQVALNLMDTRVDITGDPLYSSPSEVVGAWMDAGLDATTARELAVERWKVARSKGGAPPASDSKDGESTEGDRGSKPKDGEKATTPKESPPPKVHGNPTVGVLVSDLNAICNDLSSKIRTDQWTLVEDKLRSEGGDWASSLADASKKPESDKRQQLKAFVEKKCRIKL